MLHQRGRKGKGKGNTFSDNRKRRECNKGFTCKFLNYQSGCKDEHYPYDYELAPAFHKWGER